jgi:hypothetical protein
VTTNQVLFGVGLILMLAVGSQVPGGRNAGARSIILRRLMRQLPPWWILPEQGMPVDRGKEAGHGNRARATCRTRV